MPRGAWTDASSREMGFGWRCFVDTPSCEKSKICEDALSERRPAPALFGRMIMCETMLKADTILARTPADIFGGYRRRS